MASLEVNKESEKKNWDWGIEEWTVPQLANFLGVSATFVRSKIDKQEIRPIKGGAMVGGYIGDRQYYKISKDEVKRILHELLLPPTQETFAQRIRRGNTRLYKELGTPFKVERILNLENSQECNKWRLWCLQLTTRRPRSRKTGDQ